jgi:hypothetical protein
MVVLRISETSVNFYDATRSNIPEGKSSPYSPPSEPEISTVFLLYTLCKERSVTAICVRMLLLRKAKSRPSCQERAIIKFCTNGSSGFDVINIKRKMLLPEISEAP